MRPARRSRGSSAAAGMLGAVLAGGASRRMGRDKSSLVVGGRSLAERAAMALEAVLGRTVVVSGSMAAAAESGRTIVVDRFAGYGPLGGIDAALHHAPGRPVFVLACDLPNVGPRVVRHLIEAAAGAAGDPNVARVWFAALGDERQPLCGVYSAGCREELGRYLAAGSRSVMGFVDRVRGRAVELDARLPFFAPDLLANLNRPEDLALARGR